MKMRMLFMLSCLALLFSCKSAAVDYRYELAPVGTGSEGSKLFKVYSYSSNSSKAVELAKYNAVHGLLFKGIVGGNGNYAQPAMVKPDVQAKHQAFFDKFFKSGEYLRFVNVSNDVSVNGYERTQVGKDYKIGVVVSVQDAALRKYLESNGVLKNMGDMFN